MDIAINDISFMYKMTSLEEARAALEKLEDVTTYIKSESVTKVRYILNDDYKVNTATMMTDNHNLSTVIKSIKDIETKRRLIELLVNCNTIHVANVSEVMIGDYSSEICSLFKDSFVVSLCSDELFANNVLDAIYNEKDIQIRNMSHRTHVDDYRNLLGIRKYERNPKHSTKEYIRGGGENVSSMPLDDDTAQKVLNKAVEINGKLYGMFEGEFFEFPLTRDNIFHGFHRRDLDIHIKQEIQRKMQEVRGV